MDLWIRSQDKKYLIKAEYVSIMEHNTINVASSGWDYDVAKYQTLERALNILNEIHQRLIDLQSIQIIPDACRTISRPLDCVYQMPEE